MADRRLYTVSTPEHALTKGRGKNQRNVSSVSGVTGGSTSVVPLGQKAGEQRVRVQYKGYNDDVLALMLTELAASESIEEVPFFGVNPDGSLNPQREDGYYSVSLAKDDTADNRSRKFPTVNMTMKRVGSREEHWRMMTGKPGEVENQFGNDLTEHFGVPAAAQEVSWFDRDMNTTLASPNTTVTTEFGDVDIYDGQDSPYTRSALLYDLPYAEEGKTDVAVWDGRGEPQKTTQQNGETALEWSKVFSPGHVFTGARIFSNGRVRLKVQPNGDLYGEEYTSGSWSEVLTPDADWTVCEANLRTIDYTRAVIRWRFYNENTDTVYRLDSVLNRGATGIVWYIPNALLSEQQDVLPSLEDWLDTVASGRLKVQSTNQTLQKRSEVLA